MSANAQKTGYTISDLSRELGGEFTEEEIEQHLQGTRLLAEPATRASPSVFVAGLCWATTESRLHDFFASCGIVVAAEVFLDHRTGRSRGYGCQT